MQKRDQHHTNKRADALTGALNRLAVVLTAGLLLAIVAVAAIEALLAVLAGNRGAVPVMLAAPLLFVGRFVYVVVRRGLEMRDLAREGTGVQGRVVGKRSFARGRAHALQYQVTYEYRDAAGRGYRRAAFVSEDLWRHLAPGDPVGVVYLPGRPQVSALQADVDAARAALPRCDAEVRTPR